MGLIARFRRRLGLGDGCGRLLENRSRGGRGLRRGLLDGQFFRNDRLRRLQIGALRVVSDAVGCIRFGLGRGVDVAGCNGFVCVDGLLVGGCCVLVLGLGMRFVTRRGLVGVRGGLGRFGRVGAEFFCEG